MSHPILTVTHLTKIYKGQKAVNDFNLSVKKGEIVGIIGPNGAGKSTLLRSIVGLTPATYEQISLFGSVDQIGLETNRRFVGSLIEAPAFIDNLSARQNLTHYFIQRQLKNKAKIDEVLTLLDLADTGNKPVKNFSLGMKQRLAIALTLLHEPEILILDEPINGLDPAGIIHIRELLLQLNRELGLTILISSHILSELEHLATRFVFVKSGQKIADLTQADLQHASNEFYIVETQDNEQAATLLTQWLPQASIQLEQAQLHIQVEQVAIHEIATYLIQHGLELHHLSRHQHDLESIFLDLTEGGR